MVVTIGVLVAQAYANPFESTKLDRLQALCLVVEAAVLLIGMLFGTLEGEGRTSLIVYFFIVIGIGFSSMALSAVADINKYYTLQRLTDAAKTKQIEHFAPKMFTTTILQPSRFKAGFPEPNR